MFEKLKFSGKDVLMLVGYIVVAMSQYYALKQEINDNKTLNSADKIVMTSKLDNHEIALNDLKNKQTETDKKIFQMFAILEREVEIKRDEN